MSEFPGKNKGGSGKSLEDPKKYDVVVIGSGGGTKLATPATRLGMTAAMCEKGPPGGTCLNRGCIPSKMLIYPAEVAESIHGSALYNITSKGFEVTKKNWEELITRISDEVDGDSNSIHPVWNNNPNLTWYKGHAKFVGPRIIETGGEFITGDRIYIAAGARPSIPPIPGLADVPYMTSTEALRQTKKPKKLIVIGAGYIAVELAFAYAALGVEVQMLARSKLLSRFDEELRVDFEKTFESRIPVQHNTDFKNISYKSGEFCVEWEERGSGKVQKTKADQLLIATGVTPNSDGLNLAATGIKANAQGFIPVDKCLRTGVEGIWAFGDIAGNYLFRHSANFEGEFLLENTVHANPPIWEPIDYTGMPYAVFSHPQLAGVGETEEELIKRGAKYVKGVNPYKSSASGQALRSTSGMAKILIERDTRRILGCHIVGHQASVMIHEVIPLMRLKGKLEDILYSVHIHPTLNEIVRNAARKARNALVEAGDKLPLRLTLK